MKFIPEKFPPQAIATLAFTRGGAIAFGYFKAQMSPPISKLETGKKNEQSYIIICQKKRSDLRISHLYDEINP